MSFKAQALFKLRKYTESLAQFSKILELDSSNLPALVGRIEVQLSQNKNAQALSKEILRDLEAIIQIDPSYHWAYYQRSLLFSKEDKLEKAIEDIKQAISLDPNHAMYHHYLGSYYWAQGGVFRSDKKYAHTEFLVSTKLNQNYSKNFSYLGEFYRIIEPDVDKSKKCYHRALSIDPLDEVAGKNLSQIYLDQGQKSLAVSLYKQITSLSQTSSWAWERLAFHQQEEGNLLESVDSFHKALKFNENDPNLLNVCQSFLSLSVQLFQFSC